MIEAKRQSRIYVLFTNPAGMLLHQDGKMYSMYFTNKMEYTIRLRAQTKVPKSWDIQNVEFALYDLPGL